MDSFEEAKALKPYLRYRLGTVVYLLGDLARKCPMTISGYTESDDYTDYCVRWPNSQNTMEIDMVADETLTD
jgi:hypothetical protein